LSVSMSEIVPLAPSLGQGIDCYRLRREGEIIEL